MSPNPRQLTLLTVVQAQGSVTVEQLAATLGVTLQTVRRDELVENAGYEYGAVDPIAEENPEQTVMQQETMQSILGAINDLPSWHRTVVMLVDVQGYDYAEAAEMLRLPLGTVKSRLSRARAALRDLLVERRVVAIAQNP